MAVPQQPSTVLKTLAGFVLIWLAFEASARGLASVRGEGGLIVCAIVLAVAIAVESLFFGVTPAGAIRRLGLALPNRQGVAAACLLSAGLLLFFPVYASLAGVDLSIRPDWYWLLPGLFAQSGIAEETLFRGYLFRHFRDGRSFWRAASLSAIPFFAVHLLLFATLDPLVAAASLVLSLSMSFPLAWLFERSGSSVVPPAIVHCTVQGAIKLVEGPDAVIAGMAVAWIVLTAVAPWALFVVLRGPVTGRGG